MYHFFKFNDRIYETTGIAGVNVSDHKIMFQRVVSKLKPITNHIAVIWGRDSNNIKNLTEESIYQLMNNEKVLLQLAQLPNY